MKLANCTICMRRIVIVHRSPSGTHPGKKHNSSQTSTVLPSKQSLQRSISSRAKTLCRSALTATCRTALFCSSNSKDALRAALPATVRDLEVKLGGRRAKVRLPKQVYEERNRIQIFKTSKAKKDEPRRWSRDEFRSPSNLHPDSQVLPLTFKPALQRRPTSGSSSEKSLPLSMLH